MFRYLNILTLAVLLIEIATGQLFEDIVDCSPWDETQISKTFYWTWTEAKSNLGDSL
jgi:hypothetical protein